MEKSKCNCKEISCEPKCNENHTHKGFSCEKCHTSEPTKGEKWEAAETPIISKSSVEDWEVEFDKLIKELDGVSSTLDARYLRDIILKHRTKLKSFIFNLLTSQEKKVRQEYEKPFPITATEVMMYERNTEMIAKAKRQIRQSVLEEVNKDKCPQCGLFYSKCVNLQDILTKEENK